MRQFDRLRQVVDRVEVMIAKKDVEIATLREEVRSERRTEQSIAAQARCDAFREVAIRLGCTVTEKTSEAQLRAAVFGALNRVDLGGVSSVFRCAVEAAATALGIDLRNTRMFGKRGTRARWAVWYVLVRDLEWSSVAAASQPLHPWGTANHTTVLNAINRIDAMRARSPEGAAMTKAIEEVRKVLSDGGVSVNKSP